MGAAGLRRSKSSGFVARGSGMPVRPPTCCGGRVGMGVAVAVQVRLGDQQAYWLPIATFLQEFSLLLQVASGCHVTGFYPERG